MSEGGRLPSKSTVHEDMFGGGDEPFWPPEHVTDFHIMIIHYVRKVIGGKTICFYHHRVTFHLIKIKPWLCKVTTWDFSAIWILNITRGLTSATSWWFRPKIRSWKGSTPVSRRNLITYGSRWASFSWICLAWRWRHLLSYLRNHSKHFKSYKDILESVHTSIKYVRLELGQR